jgi:hypothetical protein
LGKISLLLLILIQAQEPPRLSKAVIVGVVLVFLVGLSLLVYFFRRYKSTEKEAQDEWDRPEQSLFGAIVPSIDRADKRSQPGGEAPAAPIAPLTFGSPHAAEMRPAAQELKSDKSPPFATPPVTESATRPTEVLHSPERSPEAISSDAKVESAPFHDDATPVNESVERTPSTTLLGVEAISAMEQTAETPVASEIAEADTHQTELLGAARVDARAPREPFETPSITPIVHRDSWEPPHIERLKPRVQPLAGPPERTEPRTQILASPPGLGAPHAVRDEEEAEASLLEVKTPVVAPAIATSIAGMRVPAGSILGLPAERSRAPLVLGAPAKPRDEIGIGALSNYGKDVDSGGGRGGTIALAAVILLLGGAIGVYLLVPSVHSRINDTVARARGIDPNPPPPVEQAKARVFPARNEANKNIVKARGAVDNISEDTLSNLSVEVSLERGNGAPPEVRKVAVNPAQLTPRQRGVFEFEYDGNRATGFSGYRIVRLLSGESEIKFTTPGRTG